MVAIGTLLFCDACGSLLPRLIPGSNEDPKSKTPKTEQVQCEDCFQYTPDTSSKVVVSKSKPSTFPSALRDKHSDVQVVNMEDLEVEETTQKTCPSCGSPEMFFHTKQLRSADEGSTVFYRCQCGYKEVQNN